MGTRRKFAAIVAASVTAGGVLMATPAGALTVAASATRSAAVTSSSQADNVYAVQTSADGKTIGMTLWEPAPGVSSRELYQRLSKHGIKGLIDPAAVSPMIAVCGRYGSANTLYDGAVCNPAPSWPRNGYTNPQIYYHDTSSSAWPVGTVIAVWNGSPNIHVTWSPNGCPGYTGTHCVDVSSANYGASGWTGETYVPYDSQSHYLLDGQVWIHLNDYYVNNTSTQAKHTACQEVAHAFGLGHNTSSGCMVSGGQGTAPTNDDYEEIIHYVYPY
jgi:hypothetical protein